MIPPIRSGDLLAVYGLLRPNGGGLERLGLATEVSVVEPCCIRGKLYDLGDFPGLTEGEGIVQGDLLRVLTDSAGPRLDAFENFNPARPNNSLYVRQRVGLLAPKTRAWVYLCNKNTSSSAPIASGDWFEHLASRSGGV